MTENAHYVNNREFSEKVVEYVSELRRCEKNGETLPIVPDYIAQCFLRIAEGLSHKANFIRYTYREEMVMDAVENCLRAIDNYDLAAATRTGKPNAFAYFTQISWYAFLRRISKEKKQQDVKLKYISESGLEDHLFADQSSVYSTQTIQTFIDTLKNRIDRVKEKDEELKIYIKEQRKKRTQIVDSDLLDFME